MIDPEAMTNISTSLRNLAEAARSASDMIQAGKGLDGGRVAEGARSAADMIDRLKPAPGNGHGSKAIDMPNNIIFISGPPRSGTTLLYGLISGGSAYPMLAECSVITSMIKNYYLTKNHLDKGRYDHFIRSDNFLVGIYATLINSVVVNAVMGMPSKRDYLVLKDPELAPYLKELSTLFASRIRSICMFRDPRDVIASLVSVHRRKGEIVPIDDVINMTFQYYYDIEIAAEKQIRSNPIMIVRYEDIVLHHAPTYEGLSDFCGYEIDRKGYRETRLHFDKSDPFYVDTYGSEVTDTRIGGYDKILNDEEISRIVSVFCGVMDRHGYKA